MPYLCDRASFRDPINYYSKAQPQRPKPFSRPSRNQHLVGLEKGPLPETPKGLESVTQGPILEQAQLGLESVTQGPILEQA